MATAKHAQIADAREQVRKMERKVLERKIAELHAARAAVPDDELEEWLEDRTAVECVLLADPYDKPGDTKPSGKRITFLEE